MKFAYQYNRCRRIIWCLFEVQTKTNFELFVYKVATLRCQINGGEGININGGVKINRRVGIF